MSCKCKTNTTTTCATQECGCKFEVDTKCIRHSKSNLTCIGNIKGDTLDKILESIDTKICELGSSTSIIVAEELPGDNCDNGGISVTVVDSETNVIISTNYVCNLTMSVISATRAEINNIAETNDLAVYSDYYIEDRDIIATASSGNAFYPVVKRKLTIVKNFVYNIAGIYKGIWDTTSIVIVGDRVVWGGRIWENLTGAIGTVVDDFSLDLVNWAMVDTTDPDYTEKWFIAKYDYTNDIVYQQTDDRNNIIYRDATLSIDYLDLTDWGCDNIYNNDCKGILNNFCVSNNFTVAYNSNKGAITNNSNGGKIESNTNLGDIDGNSNTGEISLNFNGSFISNNGNAGVIYENSCLGAIYDNLNLSDISNNSNLAAISGNTANVTYITSNSNLDLISSNDNVGPITMNKNAGSISNNTNNGGISRNVNTGDINGNENDGLVEDNNNNGDISNNSIVGVIENNANNGDIFNNTQTSGTCNIIRNNNNGNISGARTTDVLGTQVDL